MKCLLNIILFACLILVADSFYSKASTTCEEEFIYDCFNPDNYHQPPISNNSNENYICKTWSSGVFKCPGTYYMAVYVDPPPGQNVTFASFESTSPGNVTVEALNGEEIENLLKNSSAEQLAQLSVNEIREGKTPVFIRFTCYENGEGEVTFKIHCDYDSSDEISIFDPIGSIQLLLLGNRDN